MSFRARAATMPKTKARQVGVEGGAEAATTSQPPPPPSSGNAMGPPGPPGFFSNLQSRKNEERENEGLCENVGTRGGTGAVGPAALSEEWPGRDIVSTLRSGLESSRRAIEHLSEETSFRLGQCLNTEMSRDGSPGCAAAEGEAGPEGEASHAGGSPAGSEGFLERSIMSPGEGGPIHEAPRIANQLLQKTVAEVERSRNLNREIKESILAGLRGLYEMVLRLTDSRNRHIADKERAKYYAERQNTLQQKLHAMKLEAINTYVQTNLEELRRTSAEAARECALTRQLVQETRREACGGGGGGGGDAPSGLDTALADHLLAELRALREECRRPTPPAAAPASAPEPARAPSTAETGVSRPGSGTYAAVAAAPARYPIIVESKNPTHTGDQIISKIKRGVDVIGMGVGVNAVRKCKNGRVAISLESERERTAMGEAIEGLGDDFTVTEPRGRDPLLRLVGVVSDLTDARVEEALLHQNAGLLQRLPGPGPRRYTRVRARGDGARGAGFDAPGAVRGLESARIDPERMQSRPESHRERF